MIFFYTAKNEFCGDTLNSTFNFDFGTITNKKEVKATLIIPHKLSILIEIVHIYSIKNY